MDVVGPDSFFVEELVVYEQTKGYWGPIYRYEGDRIFLKESLFTDDMPLSGYHKSRYCEIVEGQLILTDVIDNSNAHLTKKRAFVFDREQQLVLSRFEYEEDYWDKHGLTYPNHPLCDYVNTSMVLNCEFGSCIKKVVIHNEDEHATMEWNTYKYQNSNCPLVPEKILLGDRFNLNKELLEQYEHCVFDDPLDHYYSAPSDKKDYVGIWENLDFLNAFEQQRVFKSLDLDFPIQQFGQITIGEHALETKGWGEIPLSEAYHWIDENELRTVAMPSRYLTIKFYPKGDQMVARYMIEGNAIWEHTYVRNPRINIDYDNYSAAIKKYCLEGNYIDLRTGEEVRISSTHIGALEYTVDNYHHLIECPAEEPDYDDAIIETRENLMHIEMDSLKESWNSCWTFRGDTLELFTVLQEYGGGCLVQVSRGKKIRSLLLQPE